MSLLLPAAWIVLAGIVAILAARAGRSGTGWFFIALLLSPLLAGVLLLVLVNVAPPLPSAGAGAEEITSETHMRCPECRELIRTDARKCKHCGSAIVPTLPSA